MTKYEELYGTEGDLDEYLSVDEKTLQAVYAIFKEKFKDVLHYIIHKCGTKKMLEKQFYIMDVQGNHLIIEFLLVLCI